MYSNAAEENTIETNEPMGPKLQESPEKSQKELPKESPSPKMRLSVSTSRNKIIQDSPRAPYLYQT